MDELLAQFLVEGRELVAQASDDLSGLAADSSDRSRLDSAFRVIHTLKGSVAIFDMTPAGRILHVAEDLLDEARAGRRILHADDLAVLVAVIDQTDRWIDDMERVGCLPATATGDADALVARLGIEAPQSGAPTDGPRAAWLDGLLAREAETIEGVEHTLVGFRYRPDADCFFRGDDPLAVVAAVPQVLALTFLPNAPWPALEALEPFECAVTIEGLSAGPFEDVRAAFRLVADQVSLSPIAPRLREADRTADVGTIQSLRVDLARIDALADGLGELIVATNAVAHIAGQADRIDTALGTQLRTAHANLERAVNDMRRAVVATRMVSLAPSLRRLPRMVREIAETLGKQVDFRIEGGTTEVDKGVADGIFEPLLHLVRNAIDHGIEVADHRLRDGKSAAGQLILMIRRDGEQLVIELADDGAGIDPAKIRAVAIERGVVGREAAEALDDAHAIQLIFAPGFSTATVVTDVSGRGVGMDAVRAAVERLGGHVEVASRLGLGTTIGLRLPLYALITRLLIVHAGGERYGVPLDRIVETASVRSERILPVGSGRACVLRERTVPIVSLAALLGVEERHTPTTNLLITQSATEPVGVAVHAFGARVDGVVRPRRGLMTSMRGIAGTTLLGDGDVLLVLDLAELVG